MKTLDRKSFRSFRGYVESLAKNLQGVIVDLADKEACIICYGAIYFIEELADGTITISQEKKVIF